MAAASSQRLEDLKLTKDEFDKIEKAMKDEEFRKLLMEYAEEISDPNNRQLYEEEIAKMEQERGNNIRWVKPEPGFVIKTTHLATKKKAFINICSSPEIAQATSTQAKSGQNWQLPYSLSSPREDRDKAGAECALYDCVFHPDTLAMAALHDKFRQMVISSAMEGIERQFNVKFDKSTLTGERHLRNREYLIWVDVRLPKLKYKGTPVNTVIRNPAESKQKIEKPTNVRRSPDNNGEEKPMLPKGFLNSLASAKTTQKKKALVEELSEQPSNNTSLDAETKPYYQIIHRGRVDMTDFTGDREKVNASRPKELVVKIDLPGVSSASGVELDTEEKALKLFVPKKYKLEVQLPYEVEHLNGNAKFDKQQCRLTITLPVKSVQVQPLRYLGEDIPMETDEMRIQREREEKEVARKKREEAETTRKAEEEEQEAARQPALVEPPLPVEPSITELDSPKKEHQQKLEKSVSFAPEESPKHLNEHEEKKTPLQPSAAVSIETALSNTYLYELDD